MSKDARDSVYSEIRQTLHTAVGRKVTETRHSIHEGAQLFSRVARRVSKGMHEGHRVAEPVAFSLIALGSIIVFLNAGLIQKSSQFWKNLFIGEVVVLVITALISSVVHYLGATFDVVLKQTLAKDDPATPPAKPQRIRNHIGKRNAAILQAALNGAKLETGTVSEELSTFHEAIRRNDVRQVRAFLKAGANVNKPSPDGFNALHISVMGSPPELVKKLIEAGADVNCHAWDRTGHTPLTIAVVAGRPDVAALLLRSGASPSLVNSRQASPLDLAKARGQEAIAEMLARELRKRGDVAVANQGANEGGNEGGVA